MIDIMTTSVTHVIKVNICKIKVTKNDKISRYCQDISQGISLYLCQKLFMGVVSDNVALESIDDNNCRAYIFSHIYKDVNFLEGRKFAIQQQSTTENVAEYIY
jgi:hypothetical protein